MVVGGVCVSGVVVVVLCVGGTVDVVVAIVAGTFRGVSEHLVGGGYGGECPRGFWVFLVSVRVVLEGEGVELSVIQGVDMELAGCFFF